MNSVSCFADGVSLEESIDWKGPIVMNTLEDQELHSQKYITKHF